MPGWLSWLERTAHRVIKDRGFESRPRHPKSQEFSILTIFLKNFFQIITILYFNQLNYHC